MCDYLERVRGCRRLMIDRDQQPGRMDHEASSPKLNSKEKYQKWHTKNMELGKEMFKFLIISKKPSPINIPLHSRINQEEARRFVCNARSSEGRLVKLFAWHVNMFPHWEGPPRRLSRIQQTAFCVFNMASLVVRG